MTIQIGKEVEEKMGVGTKSKAILQHLLRVHVNFYLNVKFAFPSTCKKR